jgi:hypothetical protein
LRQFGRRRVSRVDPIDDDVAFHGSLVKVRDEPVEKSHEGGLAASRWPADDGYGSGKKTPTDAVQDELGTLVLVRE